MVSGSLQSSKHDSIFGYNKITWSSVIKLILPLYVASYGQQFTFFAIALATCGPANPGIVATMFDMPIRIPAYLGAISR